MFIINQLYIMTLQKKTLNKPQTPYKRFEVLKEFF